MYKATSLNCLYYFTLFTVVDVFFLVWAPLALTSLQKIKNQYFLLYYIWVTFYMR